MPDIDKCEEGPWDNPEWDEPWAAIKAWIRTGIALGYCSELVCSTHTADYLTVEEAESFLDGEDPCAFVLRVWDA